GDERACTCEPAARPFARCRTSFHKPIAAMLLALRSLCLLVPLGLQAPARDPHSPESQSPRTTEVTSTELFSNPTFADDATGWALRSAEAKPDGGRDGGPS